MSKIIAVIASVIVGSVILLSIASIQTQCTNSGGIMLRGMIGWTCVHIQIQGGQ